MSSTAPRTSPLNGNDAGMRRSRLAPLLKALYRGAGAPRRKHLGDRILRLICRLEGGPHHSLTARDILATHHDVVIGSFSRSGCFDPTIYTGQTTIGRYCSISRGIRIYGRNHPVSHLSTHALFYDPALHLVDDPLAAPDTPMTIGHDVWIGAHVLILPGCRRIGDGAVIGAGTIVTRDVPDFAVVVGNPGRVVKSRFAPDVIERIRASRWWDRSPAELTTDPQAMNLKIESGVSHPLIPDHAASQAACGGTAEPDQNPDCELISGHATAPEPLWR
jgi:acetyltransferase-like isoleucine patch superfamily enzyme